MSMRISVIIPTLNEESCLPETLAMLAALSDSPEVIVADGGSSDQTCSIARQGGCVISSPLGRAVQMNAGAAAATGDVLLFLHADTHLPPDGLAAVREALSDTAVEAGAFRLRFYDDSPFLNFYAACTRLPIPSLCFGDRALFVRRATFEEIGGFPDIPIFEDIEIVRTLHRRGSFRFLGEAVTTSARRFRRQGIFLQQMQNAFLWSGHFLGIPSARLAAFYGYERS